jgi:phage repressor protein C with HTH and peptisase S24 domain
MIDAVLARIEKRLLAVDLKAAQASRRAGLSPDAIRNLRRAAKGELTRQGASTRTIDLLAPVLGTTPGWLLDGVGEEDGRDPSQSIPIMGYVGERARVEPEFEQVPAEGLDRIELPFAISDAMIAFVIRGDTMMPAYNDGDAVVVYRDQSRPIESFFGEEAVVRTVDGHRYLKTIMRGADHSVSLTSFNARPLDNVEIAWVGEIFATIPGSQLRKMRAKLANAESGDGAAPRPTERVVAGRAE